MRQRLILLPVLLLAGLLYWVSLPEEEGLDGSLGPGAASMQDGLELRDSDGVPAKGSSDSNLVESGASERKAADEGWSDDRKRLRGELRFFTADEFLRRLKELGLDTGGGGSFEPQSPEMGSLSVLVTSEEAESVRRATIILDSNAPGAAAQHVSGGGYSDEAVRSSSGREGVANLANLEPGSYMLAVEHRDFLTRYFAATKITRGQRTFVEAVMKRSDSVIAGRVQDTLGIPISGVSISAGRQQEGGVPIVTASVSRPDGTFSVGVEKGTQNYVLALAFGYQDKRIENVIAGEEHLVIEMEVATTIKVTGYVTEGDTPEPITSFTIDGVAFTDPGGRFTVERNASTEPAALVFSADGFQPRTMSVDLSQQQNVNLGQVALYGRGGLKGIVLIMEGDDTVPVESAEVSATMADGSTLQATTGTDGLFEFLALDGDSTQLSAFWPGAAPYSRQIQLSQEEPTYVEVLLDGGEFEVSGTIRDDSNEEPIADARVELVGQPDLFAMTAVDGTYTLTGISQSSFELRATAVGYSEELSPSLAGNEEGATWDARLKGSGLRIQLTHAGSSAPEGTEVVLWQHIVASEASALAAQAALATNRMSGFADEEGRVSFEVEPGTYFVSSPTYQLLPKELQVTEESSGWVPVSLPGSTLVQGRILNSDGSPVANTSLWLHSGDQDYSTMSIFHTDNGGTYSIPNLAPRAYALSILKNKNTQSAQFVRELQPGGGSSQSFDVQFPALSSSITGTLVDQAGMGVGGVQIGVEHLDAPHRSILAGWVLTQSDGSFSVPDLQAGRHLVRTSWTAQEAVFSDVVILAEGETQEVDLVLPSAQGRHVRGTMIASDGGPLGGNFVFATDSQGRQNGNFFSSMDWGYAGSFDVGGLAPGSYQMQFTAMGCKKKTVQVQVGSDVNSLVVVMERELN